MRNKSWLCNSQLFSPNESAIDGSGSAKNELVPPPTALGNGAECLGRWALRDEAYATRIAVEPRPIQFPDSRSLYPSRDSVDDRNRLAVD